MTHLDIWLFCSNPLDIRSGFDWKKVRQVRQLHCLLNEHLKPCHGRKRFRNAFFDCNNLDNFFLVKMWKPSFLIIPNCLMIASAKNCISDWNNFTGNLVRKSNGIQFLQIKIPFYEFHFFRDVKLDTLHSKLLIIKSQSSSSTKF